jgi:hypothetical protein
MGPSAITTSHIGATVLTLVNQGAHIQGAVP